MTEIQKMQRLHLRASLGEDLTADERAALQNWYDELDREEAAILNRTRETEFPIDWREKLNATLAEIARTSANVERIAQQNDVLRRENERLRQLVESRLLEKAA